MDNQNKIKNIDNTIQEFINSSFKSSSLLENVLKQYKELNDNQKNVIEKRMYVIYRGKFGFLFSNSFYKETLFWMYKTMQHERFSKELKENKSAFLSEAVKTLLILYLEDRESNKLIQAKEYFEQLEKIGVFDEQTQDIYSEDTKILYAIRDNGLWTETNLTVPIAMNSTLEPVKVFLQQDELVASVSCTRGANNSIIQTNGNVTRFQDRESIVSNSKWTVKINNYLSCEKNSSKDKTASVMQEIVCKSINLVIDQYRQKTGEYWIKRIYPSMIGMHSIKYGAMDTVFRNIPMYDRGTYEISPNVETLSLSDIYESNSSPLYEKLYLDAKAYLLIEELGESVLLLNMAFENFTYEVICPCIEKISKGKYAKNFYYGVKKYDDYFLKDYITEEEYKEAVSKKIIKASGTSMYAIYKILWNESSKVSSRVSKTKMNKLISCIRDNRNEFSHGSSNTKKIYFNKVKEQLDAFQELIEVCSIQCD
ncbi:hypothetical protein [Companilactobacillus bobalius]|uniref:Apea-like HEPN domain-containing protein n=2 Tax=Companilactobacillus bobalius TaxID=2801451 RepID=A0A202F9E5_9LACO|nr:hypothetical protein [Companilactobacillus bobalius]KRK82443.1 hypothetical protein FC78_GL002452 [Companilactobacillus bobalius DSM 19674]OVE97114.1 hypothetical protein LKACC16343_02124 [Companilactobacillus bobalius]GEO58589.1 hypothetical protein LBO01_17180 [Companilactobacillus paralimentarius]